MVSNFTYARAGGYGQHQTDMIWSKNRFGGIRQWRSYGTVQILTAGATDVESKRRMFSRIWSLF